MKKIDIGDEVITSDGDKTVCIDIMSISRDNSILVWIKDKARWFNEEDLKRVW